MWSGTEIEVMHSSQVAPPPTHVDISPSHVDIAPEEAEVTFRASSHEKLRHAVDIVLLKLALDDNESTLAAIRRVASHASPLCHVQVVLPEDQIGK